MRFVGSINILKKPKARVLNSFNQSNSHFLYDSIRGEFKNDKKT